MSTKFLMDVEEYLHTSFDDGDCEYLDGEVVERNVGELPHARIQIALSYLLLQLAARLKLQVVPEIRIQIHARRFRVADLAVWREGPIGETIPTIAPFLVIEILSPEDRMIRMQPKLAEYLSIGVEWVWVIDPREKMALCYSKANPAGAACEILRTENPDIEIPLEAVLNFKP